ncbi:MAG: hypothetical protein ACR2HS_04035 [Gammaproteobacteria bacterium]
MFIVKNILTQYRFHQAFKQGFKLLDSGKEEEAFNIFNTLLNEEPFNPYLRRQIIMLGEKLNKEVNLPTGKPLEDKNKKLFTPK